jgi:hypothetical protein
LFEFAGYLHRAGAAAWIVADGHRHRITYVGDAVLEQDEDVGAVVRAQSVTGAQVLIDPYLVHPDTSALGI